MNSVRLIPSLLLCAFMALSTQARTQETSKESAAELKPDSVQSETESKESTKMQRLPFRGKISKVDLEKGAIILKGKTKTRVFKINKETKIQKHGKPAKLKDAKVGEQVGGYAEKTEIPDTYKLITLRLGPKPGAKEAAEIIEEEDPETQSEQDVQEPVEKG